MSVAVQAPGRQLPWESSREEDARFRRILLLGLGTFILLAWVIHRLPLPAIDARQPVPDPALTRVLLEARPLPVRTPDTVLPPPRPEPLAKDTPQPDVMQPAPTQQSKNDIDSSAPKQPPDAREQLHNARARAAQTGILAFKDDLQQMRESVDLANLNQTQTSRGESSAQALKRSIVTSSATGYSGGITTDSHSIDTGGPALAARQTTRVQGRPTGDAGKSSTTGAARAAQPGGRSDEAIRRVMDENKGAIFAIYNRALRRDPLLEGKLVFEMLINPDGSVSDIQLLSSELQDTTLTGKLLGRIRMINFGAADVSATRVNYSFDFLPYT